MATYSHSRLETYQNCPLKYKLQYVDRIDRQTKAIETFLGNVVHGALEKCYSDAKLAKVNSIGELTSFYDALWDKSWHDAITVTKKGLTPGDYRQSGRKMIEAYCQRYAPFDSDVTIGTELNVRISLDDSDRYKLQGKIDRLSRTADGVHQIHDYKTAGFLPGQEEADNDPQLALYQIGVRQKWPHMKEVKLIWHYLRFDTELVSLRSEEDLSRLAADTVKIIDTIEAAEDFPPRESGLCDWCEYPHLCPKRKHFVKVEDLPVNEYLKEPGVALVNKYAELREKASEIQGELEALKEAIIDYAKREQTELIKGSRHKVRVRVEEKLRFPAKADSERKELEDKIRAGGKWTEVSQLDTTLLAQAVEDDLWSRELSKEVLKYARNEETASVYVSRLKEGEE